MKAHYFCKLLCRLICALSCLWVHAGAGASLEVGQPAPPFAAPDQDGKVQRLSDYAGRTLILVFYTESATPQ